MPYLENFVIDYYTDKAIKIVTITGNSSKIKYVSAILKENIFDIDSNISDLEIYVKKLLDNINIIDEKYKEFFNFIKNIKDKELLNLAFCKG